MYRIVWCRTKNPLGETHSRDEERKENVILWIMVNHQTLTRLSAGYTVYLVGDDGGLGESIWNWESDKDKCFGKLFVRGFPRMIHMVAGELHVYTDALSMIHDPYITLEPGEFAELVEEL